MTCDDLSQFVHVAEALLQLEESAAADAVAQTWSPAQLETFVRSERVEAAVLAARALGLIGTTENGPALARGLADARPEVVGACEDGLWAIWVRAGGPEPLEQLHSAIRHLKTSEVEAALRELQDLRTERPDFAEAHHQWAVAQHTLGHLEEARTAYEAVVGLNPLHYPAHCALGHLAIERDEYQVALDAYRAALDIHPNLPDLREIVPQLDQAIAKRIVA